MQNAVLFGYQSHMRTFSLSAPQHSLEKKFDGISYPPPFWLFFYSFFGYWPSGGAAFAVFKPTIFQNVRK
ncbi:MAG: hypothetical protein HQL80_03725 [Magnetococcales bacterium]|nr:hypothetical protein [Magnetococcales bacterium]